MQIVRGPGSEIERIDVGRALPVGADPRAQSIVEIAELRLDIVARRSTARSCGVAVEIIEHRSARSDPHLVDEGDRVGQRQLHPAAAAVAAGTAEESAASAAAPATTKAAPAAALTATAGRRTSRALRRASAWSRSLSRSTPGSEAELLPQLVDDRLRGLTRFQRLGEIKADPHLVAR